MTFKRQEATVIVIILISLLLPVMGELTGGPVISLGNILIRFVTLVSDKTCGNNMFSQGRLSRPFQ